MNTVIEVFGFAGDQVTIVGDHAGKEGIWLESDVSGLVDPKASFITRAPANRPGQRLISYRILERTLTFKVCIENGFGGGSSWEERDARWRRLWAFDKYTTIRVTTRKGYRELKCRLEEIEVDTRYDPHVNSATSVIMTVTADDPFWYGPEEVHTVTVSPGRATTITVPVANPTENPVFPIWVLEAPGTWTIPDYDELYKKQRDVTLPTTAPGQTLLVNQDPASRQIEVADQSLFWARMNGVRFKGAIPPRTDEMKFQVSLVGSGPLEAQLRLKRPYSRPWGEV